MVQPEFTPVEIVGYEVVEAGSLLALNNGYFIAKNEQDKNTCSLSLIHNNNFAGKACNLSLIVILF